MTADSHLFVSTLARRRDARRPRRPGGLRDCGRPDGGLGVALLAPFDERRLFSPFRPIAVSPLGISAAFTARGVAVIESELLWVWLPFALLGLLLWRRAR